MPDAVVIGSGPNGLVAANYLADAGLNVVVFESEDEPGGAVRTKELTRPGFHHDLFSAFYPLALVSPALGDLHLEEFGLRWRHAPLALAHPLLDQRCAVISTDVEETSGALEALAPGDGLAWQEMMRDWSRVVEPLKDVLFRPFPPISGTRSLVRDLGALGLLRFVRHSLLPVRRMGEERFKGEGARLLLGGCSLHTDLSPEAAGSGFYGWLLACLAQQVGFPVPQGGAGALTRSLVERLTDRGGKVVCGSRVARVIVRQGRAVAVRLASGDTVDARRAVVADVSATSLFGALLDKTSLPSEFLRDLEFFQWDMATVKVDFALSSTVPWQAEQARRAGTVHVADDLDNLTEFAAHIAMGQLPARPFLVVGQQSVADPSRSPPGTETAWAYTHVPRVVRQDGARQIDDVSDERWLDPFVERIERRIERLAPGFRSLIVGRHVFSPAGLERHDANLDGGAIGGGTSQFHQQLVLRPVPGMGRAETPIAGLYLASSSSHPGGGVHGASGANAARAALLWLPKTRSYLLGRGESTSRVLRRARERT